MHHSIFYRPSESVVEFEDFPVSDTARRFEEYLWGLGYRPNPLDLPGFQAVEVDDFLSLNPDVNRNDILQHAAFLGPLVKVDGQFVEGAI